MKCSIFSVALAATAASAMALDARQHAAAPAPGRVLIGNNGKISLADYDGSEFKITMQEDDAASPSWLAYAGDGLLYAVDEWSKAIRSFSLDVAGNNIEMTKEANGSTGCVHLEFNKDKTRMVGSAYGEGKIDIWNIEDGGLELVKTLDAPGELGPNKERQAQPYPHQANLDPSGRFFAVNDLGTDSIYILDSESDYEITNTVKVPAGNGPRHGSFYPTSGDKATHYFVLGEMKNRITSYAVTYTEEGLEFDQIEDISSFGPSARVPETAAAGELVIVADHVYVSNRLTGEETDSIAHFVIAKCKKSGQTSLKFEASVSTGAILPRMFSVSSSGKELFVGNQGGALGVVSIGIKEDGSMEKQIRASIKNEAFVSEGAQFEDGAGPAWVKQIA